MRIAGIDRRQAAQHLEAVVGAAVVDEEVLPAVASAGDAIQRVDEQRQVHRLAVHGHDDARQVVRIVRIVRIVLGRSSACHLPLPNGSRTVSPSSSFIVIEPAPRIGCRRNRHHCLRTLGRSGNGTRR